MSASDDAGLAAWPARRDAWLKECGAKAGFDDATDHAALIVRFMEAERDRYSTHRQDAVLAPIIERAAARYAELRGHDFAWAQQVARTEAVRAILALDLGAGPSERDDRDWCQARRWKVQAGMACPVCGAKPVGDECRGQRRPRAAP